MNAITKEEIISQIKNQLKSDKVTKLLITDVFNALTEVIIKLAQTDNMRFNIPNFGSFSSIVRKPTTRVNPQSKKVMSIPSKRTLKFTISKNLKNLMNN